MKKVTVIGGSGFLGSYIADELTKRGYDVLVADIKYSNYLKDPQRFLLCDITDPSSLEAIVDGSSVVYNFAGLADMDESHELPRETIEQNVIGTLNVLETCKDAGLERFVYASSAYALSNKGGIYGISKLASEKIVEEYSRRYGVPFTIIRYGSLYGERAGEDNGVYKILKDALTTQMIHHYGDGEEVREYIHASDAAALSVDILEDDKFVNQHTILTGVERMRQKDLLRMIQEVMNCEIEVTYSEIKRAAHYEVTPYSYHPNTARKLVSNSFIDLGQGLVSCINHIDNELHKKLDET
ncbi:NAD-dependent epimerase/dehydratase family protein [Rhodospirillales bacterium]|nr:NAD-dependent epimerase/dehydratase family protein [Rhodospirillales bacterium]